MSVQRPKIQRYHIAARPALWTYSFRVAAPDGQLWTLRSVGDALATAAAAGVPPAAQFQFGYPEIFFTWQEADTRG